MKRILSSQNIKISAIGSLGIKFFSAFFVLLSGVILARTLGLEGLGVYTISFTTVTLISIPVSLGLPNLITRYISKYEVENNHAAIKGLLLSSNRMIFFNTLVILVLALISYFLWWKNLSPILVRTLWISFIMIPLIALGSIRSAALRGLRFVILGQLPDTLLRNFLLCFGVSIYYLMGIKLTPDFVMIIHAIAAFIAYIVGYYFLYIKLNYKIKNINPEFHKKLWIKEAIPFSVNGGIQIVRSRITTYIIAYFGDLKAVALFDVALKGAALASFTLDALNTAIAPYIVKAFEKGSKIELQKIITKSTQLIFFSSLPVALFFILGGQSLVKVVFGEKFYGSYIPLVILCVGQLVSSICGSVGLVLSMTGNQKYYTQVNFYFMIATIILGIPFVYFMNVVGASLLVSLLLVVQNFVLLMYIKKTLKVSTTIF